MVVVGSSLMVALNGLTAGFGVFIERQFNNLATNVLTLSTTPEGRAGGGGFGGGAASTGTSSITFNSAVVNNIKGLPLVNDVVPTYSGRVTLESQGTTISSSVFSVDFAKLPVIAPTLQFTDGSTVPSSDPTAILVANSIANPDGRTTPFLIVGQTVQVTYSFVDPYTGENKQEARSFVVRGIIQPTGNFNIDRAVIISPDAANSLLHKNGRFDTLMVAAASADDVNATQDEIKSIYGNNIGISTPQAQLQTRQQFTSGFTSFIMAIALVALVVGAVGIVTSLYTSVNERIREIGTIKAIGALNKDILLIFLSEASIIGIIGATVGLVVGIGSGYLLTNVINVGIPGVRGGQSIPPVYLPGDLLYVWGLSVALSLLAGIYPAWKASRLDPIVALRRE
jgi:putative ABC transport system permease protein